MPSLDARIAPDDRTSTVLGSLGQKAPDGRRRLMAEKRALAAGQQCPLLAGERRQLATNHE